MHSGVLLVSVAALLPLVLSVGVFDNGLGCPFTTTFAHYEVRGVVKFMAPVPHCHPALHPLAMHH